MAKTGEFERTVRQSVLDRLIDEAIGRGDPARAAGSANRFRESVEQLKDSVRRDLEWLLNTRRTVDAAPERYAELARSLYHYGIPDLTSLSRDSVGARRGLLHQVEAAVALFEPRLTDVRITPVEVEGEGFRRELRFLIEAMLRLDPNPEPVVFDTRCELATGEVEVRSDARA